MKPLEGVRVLEVAMYGFAPASRFGVRAPFEVPDEAMMAMALDDTRPVPVGTLRHPAAFGG